MPMNINPMQLIQMIKGGQNPQQLVMNMLEQQMQNTPMGANLFTVANPYSGYHNCGCNTL